MSEDTAPITESVAELERILTDSETFTDEELNAQAVTEYQAFLESFHLVEESKDTLYAIENDTTNAGEDFTIAMAAVDALSTTATAYLNGLETFRSTYGESSTTELLAPLVSITDSTTYLDTAGYTEEVLKAGLPIGEGIIEDVQLMDAEGLAEEINIADSDLGIAQSASIAGAFSDTLEYSGGINVLQEVLGITRQLIGESPLVDFALRLVALTDIRAAVTGMLNDFLSNLSAEIAEALDVIPWHLVHEMFSVIRTGGDITDLAALQELLDLSIAYATDNIPEVVIGLEEDTPEGDIVLAFSLLDQLYKDLGRVYADGISDGAELGEPIVQDIGPLLAAATEPAILRGVNTIIAVQDSMETIVTQNRAHDTLQESRGAMLGQASEEATQWQDAQTNYKLTMQRLLNSGPPAV